MTGTTYQVTLSTGGQVAVTVTAEDPAEMKASLAWAELAYKHLVDSQGRKEDQLGPGTGTAEGGNSDLRGSSCPHGEAAWEVRGFLELPREERGWELLLL